MRFHTLCSLAIALSSSLVSALTAEEATAAINGLSTYIYDNCKAPVMAMIDPSLTDGLPLLSGSDVSIPTIMEGLQIEMQKAKDVFGASGDGETFWAKGDGTNVYEDAVLLIIAFGEFMTSLIDVYELEQAKVEADAPTIAQHLRDLGPDDQTGKAVHSVLNRIGYWMNSEASTAFEENMRPLVHYHIPLCIEYYSGQVTPGQK